MKTELELSDSIYEQLNNEANQRGVTISEIIRWIIGDYIKYATPSFGTRIALPSLQTIPPFNPLDKFTKLAELALKMQMKSGLCKCSDCTMPLSWEAIQNGKCQNCGAEI